MKIGVLTTSYPHSSEDPAGHFVRGLSQWLAAHVGGVEVLACASDEETMLAGGLPERLRGAGGALVGAAISARLLAAARRRQSAWSALVSHWILPSGAVGLFVQRRRYHLAIAHGSDVALARALPGGQAFARALARRADLVYVAESLRIEGANGRVEAMPASGPAVPRSDEERRLARAQLGLAPAGDGPLVALFLGRLVRDKGVDWLLEASGRLGAEVLQVLIAGDGPERAALERHPTVRDGRARLLGPRYGADKRALLCAADLLVVPSRQDGAPTVIAEARAAGLPVLATRTGGLPTAVGGSGWLVDPEPAAIYAELRRLSHDQKTRSWPVKAGETWAEIAPRLWRGPLGKTWVKPGNLSVINC